MFDPLGPQLATAKAFCAESCRHWTRDMDDVPAFADNALVASRLCCFRSGYDFYRTARGQTTMRRFENMTPIAKPPDVTGYVLPV